MRPNAERPAAVLLGASENGLSVARSLGRRGIRVHAVGSNELLRRSRFVDWISNESEAPPASWVPWLLGEGREHVGGSILLPCNDDAVERLALDRHRLESIYRLMPGEPAAVLAMLDKEATYARARELGVETPRSWLLGAPHELAGVLGEIAFPCLLKPRSSHRFRRQFGVKAFVAEDASDLARHLDRARAAGLEMIATEIVPGPEDAFSSYWTYVADGRPLFHFTKRKLRQYPIHFGGGTFHVTHWDPEIAELGLRFVRGVELDGLAAVEFKRDARDGRWKLIECNVRFTSALEIAARSGLDVAALVYDHLTGAPNPGAACFRDGVTLWFPALDVRALAAYRRSGELSFGKWAASIAGGPHVAWLHWTDPLPALSALWNRLHPPRDRGRGPEPTAASKALAREVR